MRAAFIEKPKSITYIENAPEPRITHPNQVKVRVHIVGICGSERHAYHGIHPWRIPPVVTGHEFAGTVVEVGDAVTDYKIGDRVTAEVGLGCSRCALCMRGAYHLCKSKRYLGATDWSGPFGEYVVIPEQLLIHLPEGVSFEAGALIEPLAVGLHAVRSSGLGMGDTACIIGCGAIGLSVLLAAKLAGATQIIVSESEAHSREIAKNLGATTMVDPMTQDLIQTVLDLTGGLGADVSYLAFGNERIYDESLTLTRPGGAVSQIAFMDPFTVDVAKIQRKGLHVMGCNAYVRRDYEIVCDALAGGQFAGVEQMVSGVYPIAQCEEAMKLADRQTSAPAIKVLLTFD